MEFNYGLEKKLFEQEWEKKKALMVESGMSEENIQKMYDYDWEWFKSVRRYTTRTINVHVFTDIPDTECSDELGGLDLLDQISDVRLFKAIKTLKKNELKLLETLVMNEKKQSDIIKEQGIDTGQINRSVSKLIEKIQKQIKRK